MKTKLKRPSHAAVSVLLTASMLLSGASAGVVSTGAADVTVDEAVGASASEEPVGTANAFTNGQTIYFDINSNSVSSPDNNWTTGNATIGALLYYDDNANWCIGSNTGDFSDAYIGRKQTWVKSDWFIPATHVEGSIYKITINTDRAGSVRFMRMAASPNNDGYYQPYNYSARMTADSMGTNNCVQLTAWDNGGQWTTYSAQSEEPTQPEDPTQPDEPVDFSNYTEVGASSGYQFYVSASNGLSNATYYYGGNTNDSYKLYTDGGSNFLIRLSADDLAKARQNQSMYYAFTDNKAISGIAGAATVQADAANCFAVIEAVPQHYNFSGASDRYYAHLKTSDKLRGFIEEIAILYNTASQTYTAYYYGTAPESDTVEIIAKDGVVRKDNNNTSAGNWFQFGQYADTVLTKGAHSTQPLQNYDANYNAYAEYGVMKKGGTITLTTTMQPQLSTYYVRGYCINGVVYDLLNAADQPLNGSNIAQATYSFRIPEDFADDYLEITPIYYLRDSANTVTFYVEDYDEAVQSTGWGNTLFADFFYANGHIEGYPGQPMVFYGGRYSMQVAVSPNATDGTTALGAIKGVTLNNGYWDYIHSTVVEAVNDNRQTYDFSNFHKIFVETKSETLDAIVFSFKGREKDNFGRSVAYPDTIDVSNSSGSFNAWEDLTNYYGEKVDIFGNVLKDEELNNSPIYIVSNGYVDNYEGNYATEWVIYNSEGVKLGVIPSSALLINTEDHWTDETYGAQSGIRPLEDYQDVYNALNNTGAAQKHPTYISYEGNIFAEYGMNTSGGNSGNKNPGYRLDGRWYYSKKDAAVSANIIIQYTEDLDISDATSWETDSFTDGGNQGAVTQSQAFFTNEEPNNDGQSFNGKTETGKVKADSSKFYTFEAVAGTGWMLEGWYLQSQAGSYSRITNPNNLTGASAMDGNATFVARFVKVYSYELTYKYESRLYGNQHYIKKGVITSDLMKQYFTLNEGQPAFKDESAKELFLAKMGPYEDNYRQTITWKFAEANVSYSDDNPRNLCVQIPVKQVDQTTVTVIFKLPYTYSLENGFPVATLSDGKGELQAEEDGEFVYQNQAVSTTYGKWVSRNGKYEYSDKDSALFVEAPAKALKDGAEMNFHYWSLQNKAGVEYAKCYSAKLNYVFYQQESYVVPVYTADTPDHGEALIETTIDFLENSRNQWNENGGGSVKDAWKLYGDRIYSDFVLSFRYNDVLLNSSDSDIKTGMLIERVQELDKDENGDVIADASAYTLSDSGREKASAYVNYKLAKQGTPPQGTYVMQAIAKNELDNKNRIQFYYSFANIFQYSTAHPVEGVPTTNKDYLYRAYAYLYDGDEVVVSEPVYFTIYQMASIASAADAPTP